MSSVFDEWKKALEALNNSVEKGIEEVQKCQAQVQGIVPDIIVRNKPGRYIRDDRRIVISAPEIIIGNVDMDGNLLYGQESVVTVRSRSVSLEGSGRGGTITSRAPRIHTIAVDPGLDGNSNVASDFSEIVNQGRAVVIDSCSDKDAFSSTPVLSTGITINSETSLTLNAMASTEGKAEILNDLISSLKTLKSEQKSSAKELKSGFDKALKTISDILDFCDKQGDEIDDIRVNEYALYEKKVELSQAITVLTSVLGDYTRQLSSLAETCRKIKAYEDIKKTLPAAGDFPKKTTGARISINSENVSIVSVDGDGNLRTNPEAGVSVVANNVSIAARDDKDALFEKGAVSISAKDIKLSTEDIKYKDENKKDSGDLTAVGNVKVVSKNVTVESVDYELTSKEKNETKEKALTKEGRLDVRFENVNVSSTDTEGKAVGKISLNAKQTEVKAFNVKKDDRKDDKIAEGGVLVLTAEKVFAGSRDKSNKTKQFQLSADKAGVFGDTTAEVQQGEGKAVVQLDGGNLSLSGGKTQIYGETTVNGKTAFKADITAPKATIDNVEASKSFKSTNINDGIAVPAAPSTAKLSAKLKTEENKPA